jgi:hypothetical protein
MTAPGLDPDTEARMLAAVDLIGRTGAGSFQLRYSDDEEPVVWMAVAQHRLSDGDDVRDHYEATAAMNPLRAVLRLAELLIDGGMCTHCRRPSGIEPDSLDTMPLDTLVCWYQYDPERRTFRRGCEGDAP